MARCPSFETPFQSDGTVILYSQTAQLHDSVNSWPVDFEVHVSGVSRTNGTVGNLGSTSRLVSERTPADGELTDHPLGVEMALRVEHDSILPEREPVNRDLPFIRPLPRDSLQVETGVLLSLRVVRMLREEANVSISQSQV